MIVYFPRLGQERVPIQAPMSTGIVLRFIVTDELGDRFIPNALVSLVFEDGTVLLGKRTDAGGNVAFSEREVVDAARRVGLAEVAGVVWATVEAPGFQLADLMVWDPDVPEAEQLQKIYTVPLKAEAKKVGPLPYILGAGVVIGAIALAAYHFR